MNPTIYKFNSRFDVFFVFEYFDNIFFTGQVFPNEETFDVEFFVDGCMDVDGCVCVCKLCNT